jgi:pimeloyl-ACP methyl ester carboxylesterase
MAARSPEESTQRVQVNQPLSQSGDPVDPPQFLEIDDDFGRRRIAFRRRAGAGPGIVWLGGFKSDMLSTKARRLDAFAAERGRALLRFDYSGHGESEGDFASGTIGQWFADALAALRAQTQGVQVLVGSSMGGWIALLVARELARTGEIDRLAGLVLIAPAVDFTQALLWPQLPEEARRDIETHGVWMRPSPYSPEPYPITRALIEDGREHLLLGQTVRAHCPVHILQGMQDPDVPWRHAVTLVEHLAGDPVALTLIKDGDHRLSREEDIARLLAAVESIG